MKLEESLRAQKALRIWPELARLGKLLEGAEEDLAMLSRACVADERRLREVSFSKEAVDDDGIFGQPNTTLRSARYR